MFFSKGFFKSHMASTLFQQMQKPPQAHVKTVKVLSIFAISIHLFYAIFQNYINGNTVVVNLNEVWVFRLKSAVLLSTSWLNLPHFTSDSWKLRAALRKTKSGSFLFITTIVPVILCAHTRDSPHGLQSTNTGAHFPWNP